VSNGAEKLSGEIAVGKGVSTEVMTRRKKQIQYQGQGQDHNQEKRRVESAGPRKERLVRTIPENLSLNDAHLGIRSHTLLGGENYSGNVT